VHKEHLVVHAAPQPRATLINNRQRRPSCNVDRRCHRTNMWAATLLPTGIVQCIGDIGDKSAQRLAQWRLHGNLLWSA